MNVVFTVIFLLSSVVLLFFAPSSLLPALLSGGEKAGTLCVSLLSSYALWLGLMRVWEKSGLTRAVSRVLYRPVQALFALENEKTIQATCMNLSANILGIGGAATPCGIRAAQLMEKEKNGSFASSMLFVVNASSLQLIPTSVIAFRVSLGSLSPADVILPTLLCSIFSSLLGILLTLCFVPKKKISARKTRFAEASA